MIRFIESGGGNSAASGGHIVAAITKSVWLTTDQAPCQRYGKCPAELQMGQYLVAEYDGLTYCSETRSICRMQASRHFLQFSETTGSCAALSSDSTA